MEAQVFKQQHLARFKLPRHLLAISPTQSGEKATLTFGRASYRAVRTAAPRPAAATHCRSAPGRGNLIARLKGAGTKSPLLLLAHVDVVPVSGQSWSVPPFALTERDGFLWGCGVNDDKGMASTIVAVTLESARQHAPLCRDVIVLLSAGEETGGDRGGSLACREPSRVDRRCGRTQRGWRCPLERRWFEGDRRRGRRLGEDVPMAFALEVADPMHDLCIWSPCAMADRNA